MRVIDLMTAPVVTVEAQSPLKDVASTLILHGVTGAPVVRDGTLVGVMSQSDLVALEEEAEEESVRRRRFRRSRRPARHTRTAADVMRSPVITIEPQSSAVGAAWLMTHHDVSRLVVVDRGELVGIVTRSDLIRAFARGDEDVRREIVDEVLPALEVSSNDVSVAVDNGIVLLAGVVEDAVVARCLPQAVCGVVGVVDVVAELSVQHDERRLDSISFGL